jgi:hypothetical protein
MKRIGLGNFGAAVMAMAVGMASVAFSGGANGAAGGSLTPGGLVAKPQRHRGKGLNQRKGKGAVNRPKRRPNMKHVSKRVRRKHRRGA